jgi:hypothetical protein
LIYKSLVAVEFKRKTHTHKRARACISLIKDIALMLKINWINASEEGRKLSKVF